MFNHRWIGTTDILYSPWSLQVLQRFLRLLKRIIKNNRILLSYAGGAIFLYFATPTHRSIFIGTPFIFLGEAIRTWASGFIKKDKDLAQQGPYSLSRNPLYLGNFFIGFGFSLMANNLILMVFFVVVFYLFYSVTIKNEERKLLNNFGAAFMEYKKRVPVFFPIPLFIKSLFNNSLPTDNLPFSPFSNPPSPPFTKGGKGGLREIGGGRGELKGEDRGHITPSFNWQLVKKHREHHTCLGIVGCLFVFILKVSS